MFARCMCGDTCIEALSLCRVLPCTSMRPLVMSWAVLHDLGCFGYVLGEVHAMVCVILYGCVAV